MVNTANEDFKSTYVLLEYFKSFGVNFEVSQLFHYLIQEYVLFVVESSDS